MINLGRYSAAGAEERHYSARTMALVEHSLVVDMLAVPRLDLSAAAYARPLSPAEKAEFRASGINVMHNSDGVDTRDQALTFLAGQQGLAGRNPDLPPLAARRHRRRPRSGEA